MQIICIEEAFGVASSLQKCDSKTKGKALDGSTCPSNEYCDFRLKKCHVVEEVLCGGRNDCGYHYKCEMIDKFIGICVIESNEKRR